MSNRIFLSKDVHLCQDPNLKGDELKQVASMISSFLQGQPERYIEDTDFWLDMEEIAFTGKDYGESSIVLNGTTEFGRTFLYHILYKGNQVSSQLFAFWHGQREIKIESLDSLVEHFKQADFLLIYMEDGIRFEGPESLRTDLKKQYQDERNVIKSLMAEEGTELVQPLHHERAVAS